MFNETIDFKLLGKGRRYLVHRCAYGIDNNNDNTNNNHNYNVTNAPIHDANVSNVAVPLPPLRRKHQREPSKSSRISSSYVDFPSVATHGVLRIDREATLMVLIHIM